MTTERINRNIAFQCDACPECFVSDSDDFDVAWTDAKDEGWIAFKNKKGQWEHRCDDCR